jgi:hypothetical protein
MLYRDRKRSCEKLLSGVGAQLSGTTCAEQVPGPGFIICTYKKEITLLTYAFFLVILGFELRILSFLGRCSFT